MERKKSKQKSPVSNTSQNIMTLFKKQSLKKTEKNQQEERACGTSGGICMAKESNEKLNVTCTTSPYFDKSSSPVVAKKKCTETNDRTQQVRYSRLSLKRKLHMKDTKEEKLSAHSKESIDSVKKTKYAQNDESVVTDSGNRDFQQLKVSDEKKLDEGCKETNAKETVRSNDTNDHNHISNGKQGSNIELTFEENDLSKGLTNVENVLNEKENETDDPYPVPYYLENFLLIVQTVTSDDFFKDLFNDDDHNVINSFLSSSDQCQKLYIRLFGRQYKWIRYAKIVYPKIGENLTEPLDVLVNIGLLHGVSDLSDVSDALKSLPAPELKTLAKTLHIPSNQTREKLIEAMEKHGKSSGVGTFFSGGRGGGAQGMILARAKKLLGRVYKLKKCARSVFMRVMMLFGLHRTRGEEDESGQTGQQQLFQMLMSNIGRLKYPEYTVNRESRIFHNRESLLSLSEALQYESEISEALESKDYDAATKIYNQAKGRASSIWEDEQSTKHAKSLPEFMRFFTAGSVYARVLSQGVELLQYQKQYKAAVNELEYLIAQDVYHTDYRGRWYDRLALNLDYHLKQPDKAVDAIHSALQDSCVRFGHRLSLFQRAHKICHTASHKKAVKNRWAQFETDEYSQVKEAKKVRITATQMATSEPGMHAGYVWLLAGGGGDEDHTIMKRVEDVALAHYARNGFPSGVHSEGGTFTLLLGLLYWDQMFRDDLADVFYHQYQSHPLDLQTDHFYAARQQEVDDRTQLIREAQPETLVELVSSSWDLHFETFCSGVNWERFENKEQLLDLVSCFGGTVLAAVLDRLVKCMRFCTSGMPDLVVWNTAEKTYKLVEVKGPGDRLSTKQILWLDYFQKHGIEAEVCYVEGISKKKIRT